jgi:beta-galactosidase
MYKKIYIALFIISNGFLYAQSNQKEEKRERINFNENWRFMRYKENSDSLIYDVRPKIEENNDSKVADSKPTEAVQVVSNEAVLKNWILPSGNDFIKDPAKRHIRPKGNPGSDFVFVKKEFQDSSWEQVNLPHDWAIKQPFYTGDSPEVGGGMGRLPSQGVAWYRKQFNIPQADKTKSIYLDIDGAMSYAMVWLNGHLVGGWPYGYNSFRLDLTPYLKFGEANQLAIRLDNPNYSARWYPGGGIYRNVWLTKVAPIHVAQWGTFVKTTHVSQKEATLGLTVNIENKTNVTQTVKVETQIYIADDLGKPKGEAICSFPVFYISLNANDNQFKESEINIKKPKLWGVYPLQNQNLYIAKTTVFIDGKSVDQYDTSFGIRNIEFNPIQGLLVNGKKIKIQGVNQHHDLGALGSAFNVRAAKRQLEMLRELGCNAIRLSHNPPAPELLALTDQMGFLVIDEIFDSWELKKTPYDFHLIFPDWYEVDTRSFIRRDRNHPSVMAWSFGNEVGEQYTDVNGAKIAQKLHDIVHDEDPTRLASASQNYAKPEMPFSDVMDFISVNYQGEGIRDAPAYAHLKGIRTSPLYPAFQKKFPEKMIVSTETASTLSSRSSYVFPVAKENSAPVSDTTGGNPAINEVSAYELYTAQFGASPEKVFAAQDNHLFVAGEFVWSGWDYLGEPTPYYSSHNSYCGIIDLAGFKKDRFYLYQSRWRPDLPMAHILPHWNWPDRIGKVTPVHVFTSGDEAELFLNGKSLGRKKKGTFEYRIRWDDVVYESGILKVVTYKKGKPWATDEVKTSGKASKIYLQADRLTIKNDNQDLSFITIKILDDKGNFIADAKNKVTVEVTGSGELIATDNGDSADMTSFVCKEKNTFGGLLLAIVRANKKGEIRIKVSSNGLQSDEIVINAN